MDLGAKIKKRLENELFEFWRQNGAQCMYLYLKLVIFGAKIQIDIFGGV